MTEIMSQLHPALSPGEFDLQVLLRHDPPMDWKPTTVGESVVGVVIRVLDGFRDTYSFPILELMDSNGMVIRVRCSAVMLKNQIEDLNVGPGSIVEISFDGKKTSQSSGREYRVFTVKVA